MISLKSLLPEDYPVDFSMEKFNAIKSYRGKIQYVQSMLKRISSGSSRIAYMIDDVKVLKLAKNKKGIAQNEVEADWSKEQWGVTAKVFEFDQENHYWMEMELAKKVSPKRFKELTGLTIEEFNRAMMALNDRMSPHKSMFRSSISDEFKNQIYENDFYMSVERFVSDFALNPGDFGKLSSFGEVIRDGNPKIVLIDFGLNDAVFDLHYRR
jgi:hypothetical protein